MGSQGNGCHWLIFFFFAIKEGFPSTQKVGGGAEGLQVGLFAVWGVWGGPSKTSSTPGEVGDGKASGALGSGCSSKDDRGETPDPSLDMSRCQKTAANARDSARLPPGTARSGLLRVDLSSAASWSDCDTDPNLTVQEGTACYALPVLGYATHHLTFIGDGGFFTILKPVFSARI